MPFEKELIDAVRNNQPEAVENYLQQGADVNVMMEKEEEYKGSYCITGSKVS